MRITVICMLIGVAGASLLAAGPVRAQWSASATVDMGVNYGQMALSQAAMEGTRALSSSSRKAVSTTATPAPPTPQIKRPPFNPRFNSDARVSQLVDQRFAHYLAGDDPAAVAAVMRDLKSGRYRAEFKQLLRADGLAADNLIDVTAAHYAAMWELVRGRTLASGQVQSIRNQLGQTMRNEPALTSIDTAARQEIAETLMLHTAVAVDGYRTLKASGDRRLLAQYRAGVQRNLLPEGPDLLQLEVGAGGFLPATQPLR